MNRSCFHPLSLVAALLCLLLPAISRAALNAYLTLVMDGNTIEGESQVASGGRANTIECFTFESEFFRPAGAEVTVHRPVKITKRIDKSTPLLAKAFETIQTGTATFKFYRTNPNGVEEHYFTVILEGARITSERFISPSSVTNATANLPTFDEVTFTYTSMRIIYINGGLETELRVR